MRVVLVALAASGLLVAAELGRPAPPLTILQSNGPSLALKQYLGKTLLVAFIETPSMECQSLIPLLSPIAREYSSRGVQVLVVAFDETAAGTVPSLVSRFNPPYPVGWTHPNAVRTFFDSGEVKVEQKEKGEEKPKQFVIPRLVFIDRKGVIRGDFSGDKPFFKDPAAHVRAELNDVLR